MADNREQSVDKYDELESAIGIETIKKSILEILESSDEISVRS